MFKLLSARNWVLLRNIRAITLFAWPRFWQAKSVNNRLPDYADSSANMKIRKELRIRLGIPK